MRTNPPRLESGHVLYFISGFLSFQIEIQNLLSVVHKVDQSEPYNTTDSDIFNNRDVKQVSAVYETNYYIASAMLQMNNSFDPDIFEALDKSMWNVRREPRVIEVPVMHRAFPTKEQYKVSGFRYY